MSKKRKWKLMNNTPPIKNLNKKESLANHLFQEVMVDTFKINQTIITDDFEITSFVEMQDQDKVVCYTIIPASNKNVSIYVDNEVINAELNKKIIVLSDSETEKLVKNITDYLFMYFQDEN